MARWVHEGPNTGDLFDNMVAMVEAAGGRIAGVLWYQGESDAEGERVERYAARLRRFIAAVRERFGHHVVVGIAQLNRYTHPGADDAGWSRVREMQRQVARTTARTAIVPTIDLALSDEIHNSAGAEVHLGERMAEAMRALIWGAPVLPWPEVASVQAVDAATLAVRTVHGSGEWTRDARDQTFRVDDAAGENPVVDAAVDPEGVIRVRLGRPLQGPATLHVAFGANPAPTLRDDLGRVLMPCSLAVEPRPRERSEGGAGTGL
jgi:hypothetical protein